MEITTFINGYSVLKIDPIPDQDRHSCFHKDIYPDQGFRCLLHDSYTPHFINRGASWDFRDPNFFRASYKFSDSVRFQSRYLGLRTILNTDR